MTCVDVAWFRVLIPRSSTIKKGSETRKQIQVHPSAILFEEEYAVNLFNELKRCRGRGGSRLQQNPCDVYYCLFIIWGFGHFTTLIWPCIVHRLSPILILRVHKAYGGSSSLTSPSCLVRLRFLMRWNPFLCAWLGELVCTVCFFSHFFWLLCSRSQSRLYCMCVLIGWDDAALALYWPLPSTPVIHHKNFTSHQSWDLFFTLFLSPSCLVLRWSW